MLLYIHINGNQNNKHFGIILIIQVPSNAVSNIKQMWSINIRNVTNYKIN